MPILQFFVSALRCRTTTFCALAAQKCLRSSLRIGERCRLLFANSVVRKSSHSDQNYRIRLMPILQFFVSALRCRTTTFCALAAQKCLRFARKQGKIDRTAPAQTVVRKSSHAPFRFAFFLFHFSKKPFDRRLYLCCSHNTSIIAFIVCQVISSSMIKKAGSPGFPLFHSFFIAFRRDHSHSTVAGGLDVIS